MKENFFKFPKRKLKTFRHIGTLVLVSSGSIFKTNLSIFRQVLSTCRHLMLKSLLGCETIVNDAISES